ncbi:MAG TPA: c-type cytochrome [Thermodesulfobacteriota bacterium]
MRHRALAVVAGLLASGLAGGTLAAGDAQAADAKTVQFFKQTCGICHGENGQGTPGLAPALKGNAFVTGGDPKEIEATITRGRQGNQKRYKEFASPMPAHSIGGSRLQALVEYLRGDLQK